MDITYIEIMGTRIWFGAILIPLYILDTDLFLKNEWMDYDSTTNFTSARTSLNKP